MTTAAFQMALPTTSSVASVAILHSMAEAEQHCRTLQKTNLLAAPYQTFELLSAWQINAGQPEGAAPLIVVAFDTDNQPLMMMALEVWRENGAQVARFMGGKHLTFNMPVWRSDFASSVTAANLDKIVRAVGSEGVDVLALTQQPKSWAGIANPLAAFAGQPSTNRCPMMTLHPGNKPEDRISTSTRRRLRNKERKLQSLPGYRYAIAATDADVNRLIDAFFRVKPLRMALSKLPNVFADETVQAFIRAACLAKLPSGERAITLHALECDDEMISLFACVADGQRFSTMFNTYTISENAKYSPGLILLRHMIDHYAELGYTSLDFGVGSDDYKMIFCKKDEPLIDGFIPLTALGKFAALRMSSLTKAKRLVKQNPAMMQMVQMLRNALNL